MKEIGTLKRSAGQSITTAELIDFVDIVNLHCEYSYGPKNLCYIGSVTNTKKKQGTCQFKNKKQEYGNSVLIQYCFLKKRLPK